MSNPLSNLDLNRFENDVTYQTTISTQVAKDIWYYGYWDGLIGTKPTSIVRQIEAKVQGGVRNLLAISTMGDMVVGNADIDTNLGGIEFASQHIYPKAYGKGADTQIEQYESMSPIDSAKLQVEFIEQSFRDHIDYTIFANLANDPTRVVCADATKGVKDLAAVTTASEAAQLVGEQDVLNLDALKRAITMARIGTIKKEGLNKEAMPLKPAICRRISNGGVTFEHNVYVVLVSSYGAEQLKKDVKWQSLQQNAGVRGEQNNSFTGLLGYYDGCPIVDFGVWSAGRPGVAHSDIKDGEFLKYIDKDNYTKVTTPSSLKGKNTPTAFAFVVGANALSVVGTKAPTLKYTAVDSGWKKRVSARMLFGCAKTKFGYKDLTNLGANEQLERYVNSDYSVVTIIHSAKN